MTGAAVKHIRMATDQEMTGIRIMELRKQKGITQEYMADELQMSQSAYSKIEKGTRKISSAELAMACKVLDTSANFLLGLQESPLSVAEESKSYSVKKKPPRLRLSIEFDEDDAVPDGPLVKKLNELIRKINAQE